MSFLSDLRGQLFILAGVKTSIKAELVPAIMGNGVEKKSSFNGFYYSLISSEPDLVTPLNHIRDLFNQAMDRLQKACVIHFENFQNEKAEKPFDLIQKTKAERQILQICTELNPFIKQFLKSLDLPYLNFLNEGRDLQGFYFYLFYAKLVQKTKNLEITTGLPVPFRVLIRIHAGLKLNAKETDTIDAWLKAVNDSKSLEVATFKGDKKNPYSSVHTLHRYLIRLSIILFWDVAKLEIELHKRGCTIFEEPDPHWIRIRKKTRQGNSFCVEGKDFVIDTCLLNPGNDPMKPMVFSIQNQPEYNLVIHSNEAIGDIQLRREQQDHYGVMMPKRLGKEGAISIVERLYHPLSSIIWESREDDLSDRDVIQAHPIVGLLAGLSLQPCTPFPLAPNLFAFNCEGEMRALEIMPMKMGPMAFESLEDFAWECSLNPDGSVNASVFTYLMHSGKLVDLPHAKSYQELVVLALEDREIDPSVSLDGLFTKPDILAYRREFFLKIQATKETIVHEILSQYQVLDVKKLHESLVSAFQAIHIRDCPGRLLVPSFFEQCKLYVLRDLKPRMNPASLSPIRKALVDKIAFSDLGNSAVQLMWQEEKKYHMYGIYSIEQQKEIYYHGVNSYKENKKS